ncbi:hypothetical protein MOQ_009797 [Trypanosoma cruzi marinkellei]|uniref:Uncharacterized protein n=1 Tax=Trypanosoma cruzi marinkellei TaxID=85056 RepID=K2LUQ1_TRYCR|nr:hypothetical protein MOQ_009797 [Trypanosoma cruzi marinkellei]
MGCGTVAHHQRRQDEDLAATPTGMDFELSDDPVQATRIGGRSVSFPDVTAQRVLRLTHWTSTRFHGLGPPSATVHCRDGGRPPADSRHAATTETCCLVLREADWNASTSACATPLATVTAWMEMHRDTVRAARRTIPRGSRDSPRGISTDGMEHAECVAAAACNAHTASPGDSVPRAEVLRKREDRNYALRCGLSMLLVVHAKKLLPS